MGKVIKPSDDKVFSNIDLLWTNPNPTGDFAAQTVSINLTNYSFVLVEVKKFTSSDRRSYLYMLAKGTPYQSISGFYDQYGFQRGVQYVNNSGVTFEGGTRIEIGPGTYYDDNRYGVPTKIYGIRLG